MENVSILSDATAGQQLENDSAVGSCRYNTIKNTENKRIFDDGVLMVVIVLIYGHLVWALIDSGATRCFVSSAAVLPLGLETINDYAFLELRDGKKSFAKVKLIMSL